MPVDLAALPDAVGVGSLANAPDLSPAFREQFRSVHIETGRLRHHAVVGGTGHPVLVLAGWPQCWFAWRHLMPALARDYQLIVVDPRGVGLSDRPEDGYDTLSQAADMFAVMDALGHEQFAFVGHDIGMWTGFAMAASQPGRIRRMVVGEALIPGVSPSPPMLPAAFRAVFCRTSISIGCAK